MPALGDILMVTHLKTPDDAWEVVKKNSGGIVVELHNIFNAEENYV